MKLKRIAVMAAAFLFALWLAGCAGGVKYDYDGQVELRDRNGAAVLTHVDFISAEVGGGKSGEDYYIFLNFTGEGREKFRIYTAENIGGTLALYVGGDRLFTALIGEEIDSSDIVLYGEYSARNEAKALAKNINDNLKKYEGQPPAAATAPATETDWFASAELKPGETMLIGNANFNQAGSFTAGFILSADGREARDPMIVMAGLKLSYASGNSVTTVETERYSVKLTGTYDITDGKLTVTSSGLDLSLTIDGKTANGTVTYSHPISLTNSTGEKVYVDMGTQPIIFSAVEQ